MLFSIFFYDFTKCHSVDLHLVKCIIQWQNPKVNTDVKKIKHFLFNPLDIRSYQVYNVFNQLNVLEEE